MGWSYCTREHSERVVIWPQANQHLDVESTEQRTETGQTERKRASGTIDDTSPRMDRAKIRNWIDIKKVSTKISIMWCRRQ